jgi:hypothetical protein
MCLGHALFVKVFYYSLLFMFAPKCQENFSWSRRDKGKKAVCAPIAVNTLSSHLRAEDAELRMELRLPALQQKIFIA